MSTRHKRTPSLFVQGQHDLTAEARQAQAVEIIARHFSTGLSTICDPQFLTERYDEFLARDDPIYVALLNGMQDDELSRTFVSYWTIAQTLATQSRFWLEDAVAEIVVAQVKKFGRQATHVYSQGMLADRYWERNVAVADLGEEFPEHLSDRKPWRPPMKENALNEVDALVGKQERERVNIEQRHKLAGRRNWDQKIGGEAANRDRDQLEYVAKSVSGRTISDVAIQCNLLVIEPERKDGKPHVFAFRFVNPKTISSHAQRKQERVNLLRLFAFLVQEKLYRHPTSIQVSVAELLPRVGSGFDRYDYYPDYFSPLTYWNADQLWEFIGVPFDVVTRAISRVAVVFREQLKCGLRQLLPGANLPTDMKNKPKRNQ